MRKLIPESESEFFATKDHMSISVFLLNVDDFNTFYIKIIAIEIHGKVISNLFQIR